MMKTNETGGNITMKRISNLLALAALLVASGWLPAGAQTVGASVEGKVTQEGQPLAGTQVVLTNPDTGRAFKTKTDKKGEFLLVGIPYGLYRVDVLSDKGEKLFSQMTNVGTGDTSTDNVLRIDIPKGGAPVDNNFGLAPSGPPPPKLTKEQLAKIKADNEKIASLNSLIADAQAARQAQDWPKAENALKQLIAAAPETTRWDFYYALGDAQSKSSKYQDAVQTYDKGIQAAQSLASGQAPADPKNPNSSPAAAKSAAGRMLTAQASAYIKLSKEAEAVASLKKAADLDPGSALTQYNLCGAGYAANKFADAKPACDKYLQLEPAGAHADEVKAFLSQMASK